MKRLALLLVLLPLGLWAQEKDSADIIVGRYLKLMNYNAIPTDSMLVLETTVTFHGSNDTFSLRRWFIAPTMMRVEVWRGDTLVEGYCTNGSTRHREYQRRQQWWDDIDHRDFHERIGAFDFRGPLYNWQQQGIELSYRGIVKAKGERLQEVVAEQAGRYTRHYFFEERSGLLVLVRETDNRPVGSASDEALKLLRVKPIEYKFIHEYMPVGEILVPSQESFMREGLLTIQTTTAHFVPRDNMLFNQD